MGEIQASAKINLSLKVLGRLSSGRHRIRSVLCPISLSDKVEIRIIPAQKGVRIVCRLSKKLEQHIDAHAPGLAGRQAVLAELSSENNLASRAADLVLRHLGVADEYAVEIELEKSIPLEAGLGGGSADAAAVLAVLPELLNRQIPEQELLMLAAELGSDVPALVFPGLWLLKGSGEILTELVPLNKQSLEELRALRFVLLKPPSGVNTAEAYKALGYESVLNSDAAFEEAQIAETVRELQGLGLKPKVSGKAEQKPGKELTLSGQDGISGLPEIAADRLTPSAAFVNDFETVARSLNPKVEEAFSVFADAGVLQVLLAGSGSSVLGVVRSSIEAEALLMKLQNFAEEGWFTEVTQLRL